MARFVRRHPDPTGTYYGVIGEKRGVPKEIKIEGRAIFTTDDKAEIEFLQADPEIKEINKKTKIEKTEE